MRDWAAGTLRAVLSLWRAPRRAGRTPGSRAPSRGTFRRGGAQDRRRARVSPRRGPRGICRRGGARPRGTFSPRRGAAPEALTPPRRRALYATASTLSSVLPPPRSSSTTSPTLSPTSTRPIGEAVVPAPRRPVVPSSRRPGVHRRPVVPSSRRPVVPSSRRGRRARLLPLERRTPRAPRPRHSSASRARQCASATYILPRNSASHASHEMSWLLITRHERQHAVHPSYPPPRNRR